MCFNKFLWSSFLMLAVFSKTVGQGNCLIYPENSGERLACELSYQSIEYAQGSAASQILFDSAIKVGPNYAYAYYEKSVPFFKRGKLIEGTQLINKAIELDPEKYLTYRAYWYFLNYSFEACISDLERFYNELNVLIMTTPGGDFEMRMLLALSYAQVGELEKAIDLVKFGIENFDSMNYFVGAYDYHVLGILLYSNNQFEEAKKAFEKQIEINDSYAGTYYYLALTNRSLGYSKEASMLFKESLDRFDGKKDGINFNAFTTYNVTRSQVVAEMD